ncbi:SPOR domain-containing protein [Rhodoferax sp.]|uniref:SPOR domain-containing protein n=1 Tax=Rhodoferax sp. TaxID=50421 RepID=UPI00272FE05A|nr:SPOR domain-containing protein [Rhodoferax sp.]MDP1528030.1 SPOR domain-containing protein [Rhodoferax sp.]MDP1944031.1 SPOR domain-containing protein [Rhodoferax sp.]MDP2439914.1 SPOR domain-containing protein [Rhodoferax sp.]MDZ4207535.1 SPOR domain-containing protein [Rhodoferax sp.]
MDFFKFRKKGDPSPSASVQPESVERMRQRARHRLVGATVLVLVGVIGFPLLFDKQPRPIAVDTPIDIPDKSKVSPLALPASPASSIAPLAPAAAAASAPQSVVITESAEPAKAVKPEASVVSPPVAVKATEADKVQALLDGKAAQEPAAAGRFVVQVGAFADPARAREVRLKLEGAGLKTYTHVAETKEGPRTRVRVGPFASKAEAEKTAERIKKLNLPAGILTL